MISFLLSNKANTEIPDNENKTPLFYASNEMRKNFGWENLPIFQGSKDQYVKMKAKPQNLVNRKNLEKYSQISRSTEDLSVIKNTISEIRINSAIGQKRAKFFH